MLMQEESIAANGSSTGSPEDRRTHDRLKLMKTIQINSLDREFPPETATVVDISREGLYFTVRLPHYTLGMKLQVNIPSLDFEGVCTVVRIEQLPGGYLGIGTLVLGW